MYLQKIGIKIVLILLSGSYSTSFAWFGTRWRFLIVLKLLFICLLRCNHRLSINKPTKRGKEKSPSDGHCQCQKDMDDHLLTCQQFLTESHIVARLAGKASIIFDHERHY
jgi:hypothetical protein